MKKLIVGLLCVALGMTSIIGCGASPVTKSATISGESNDNNNDKIAALESQIAELESENESLQDVVNSYNFISDNSTEPAPSTEIKQVNLNTPIVCDGIMEMTITSAEWLDEILPSDTSGAYSYYEDTEGEIYFVLKGTIKNTSGDIIDIQYGSYSEMTFNDTYKYNSTWTAESSEHNDFWGNQINPLQSTNFIMYVSVPDEVKANFQSCDIKFGFEDALNCVYDWNDCTHIYELTIQ